jgi:NAD(P)-dependent dehydrogenase (short-subunit alcohol dehydrogenase family)
VVICPQPARRVRPGWVAVPPRCVVLTDDVELAVSVRTRVAAPSQIICTASAPDGRDWPAGVHRAADVDPSVLERPEFIDAAHIRVITRLGGAAATRAWPAPPPDSLIRLHDLTFLTAQRYRDSLSAEGTVGVLALEAQRHGPVHPYAALFTGLLKSFAWELNRDRTFGVLTDNADLDGGLSELACESAVQRTLPYAVYRNGVRHAPYVTPAPIVQPAPWPLPDGSVVVANAARGLTTSIIGRLAQRSRIRVWLLGLSALDSLPADVFQGTDEEFAARRQDVMAEQHRRHPQRSAAELNGAFERLIDARESRRSLDELRKRLGKEMVSYVQCDITDIDAVRAAARRIRAETPHIDLLIHAASKPGSRSLAKKTLANFRAGRDVKVIGYHHLKSELGDAVGLWCNFGSIIGVLGLPGDPEYATANDYVAAAATYENAVRGRDEFSINWTWWKETGISTRPLRRAHMGRQGWLTGITTEEGIDYFCDELCVPPPRPPMSVQIGAAERATFGTAMPGFLADAEDRRRPACTNGWFYLDDQTADGTWCRTLDPITDANLLDHVVSGRPTMPGSHSLEMAAEAASALRPDLTPVAFTNVAFTAFLRLGRQSNKPFRVRADVMDSTADSARVQVRVLSDVTAPSGEILRRDRVHYVATVLMVLPQNRPSPPRRPLRVDGSEQSVPDPYYTPGLGVTLDGAYVSTSGCWIGPGSSRSTLNLSAVQPEPAFARFVVPCLAVDALTRIPNPDATNPQRLGLAIPLGYDQVDVYTNANDVELDKEYGTSLAIVRDLSADSEWRCEAVDPNGRVLISVQRPRLKTIAYPTTEVDNRMDDGRHADVDARQLALNS